MAIMKFKITTTPNCTKSMPKALTVGSSTGTNTSSITAPSSTVPKIKNITLTSSMKTIADRFKLAM